MPEWSSTTAHLDPTMSRHLLGIKPWEVLQVVITEGM